MADTPEPREENRLRGPGTVRATASGPPDRVRGRQEYVVLHDLPRFVVVQPRVLRTDHLVSRACLQVEDELVHASLCPQLLKHLRAKLLQVVVDRPPETVECTFNEAS
jgi:hypothetical protein